MLSQDQLSHGTTPKHTECVVPLRPASKLTSSSVYAGPDLVPAVDANRGWDLQHATRFARLIEPLDIRWFEGPCHSYDDAAMMARLRRRTRIPITAGQSEITVHAVRRLLDANAEKIKKQ